MRPVALLAVLALAGCDLVFQLDGPGSDEPDAAPPGIEFRAVFIGAAPGSSTLRIDRPAGVQADDVLIAVIHATEMDETTLVTAPDPLELLADGEATQCNDDWHTWIFAGRAGDLEAYDFTFDGPDNLIGLVTAYANARAAFLLLYQGPAPAVTPIAFPPTMATPGSVMWMGGAASMAWEEDETPSGTTKRGSLQVISVFDQLIADGVIPEVTIAIPVGFCPGVAQVIVQQ